MVADTTKWCAEMILAKLVKEYQEQGYKKAFQVSRTKLADSVLLTKERRLFRDHTLLVYYVNGDVSVAHVKDLCKRLIRMYKSDKLKGGSKVHLAHSGELDPDIFDAIYDKAMSDYPEFKIETQPIDSGAVKKPGKQKPVPRKKRKRLAKASRTLILKSQQFNCAECKTDISKLPVVHFDHRIPLAMGGSNEDTNRQALCPTCHAYKTQKDAREISLMAQRNK